MKKTIFGHEKIKFGQHEKLNEKKTQTVFVDQKKKDLCNANPYMGTAALSARCLCHFKKEKKLQR